MRTKDFLPAIAVILVLAAGCQAREPEGQPEAAPSAANPAPSTAPDTAPATAAAPPAASPESPQPVPAPASAPAPAAAASLASQPTNWPGIVADVTEFRRKGSTLTAKVVLRNQGTSDAQPDVRYDEVYVMDAAAGKKYEVLQDEKGHYIAALRSGWNDRWYQKLAPTESYTLWMKFPAPPPETRTVTLQVPGVPPFEDLPIQDS